ncbi:hypothetical protein HYPSUDRAFT_34322 [Hypholoma sublateritium FD-334 SS-4]|uniref:Uncharacterized protein n=1 Tax=Hypholoma sublateritium (strain FD-334 SS-4) TaxID=945553 RepID=A0A0D2PAU8_HYPSF|nr:hypothetical protein HYPSUDRAFT_34322 [Hypholoma sublateritium FD-334 SS-4]
MCVDEGRGSECTHRKPVDAGSVDAAEGGAPQFSRPGDERPPPSGRFHDYREVPLTANGHALTQWESYAPRPHSHPLHSLYPTMAPQAQYYILPHLAQHPTPSTFPISGNMGSQHNHYYASESDVQHSHFFEDASTSNGCGSFFNSPRGPE